MLKEDYKIYEGKMKKSIDSVAADFASVRAGRANASVLDRIMVDYYGSPTPIQQIAAHLCRIFELLGNFLICGASWVKKSRIGKILQWEE